MGEGKISVVDYGTGNIASVRNALGFLGIESLAVRSPAGILKAEKIILPGVGSFGAAMEKLRENRLDSAIREAVRNGKPLLGICLGYQILFEKSEESPKAKGLGLLEGKVVRFSSGKRIPQIGWNSISVNGNSRLLEGMDSEYVYFVHSFFPIPEEKSIVSAETDYCGENFASAVESGNIFGVQFHPEKSSKTGLEILRRFAEAVE